MTTIEFERTPDDVINFNLSHLKRSPSLRRRAMMNRIISTVLVLGIAFFFLRGQHTAPINAIGYSILLLGGGIYFLVYPLITAYTVRNRIKNMLKEGNNTILLGKQQMIIRDDGLHCIGAAGETLMKWEAIERIETSATQLLIYIGSMNAMVVPTRAFSSDTDLQSFIAALQSHLPKPGNQQV